MRNSKSIISLLLFNLACTNVALAYNMPNECPSVSSIKEQKWIAGDIVCNSAHCLYKMGGSDDAGLALGSSFAWHFHIDFKINALEDIDFAKSKTLSIIDTLSYQSGPNEVITPPRNRETSFSSTFTCVYNNTQGATVTAVVTDVNQRP